jgi:hypothetical protein
VDLSANSCHNEGITQTVESLLSPELAPDEHLLWSGQPQQGIFLRRSDALFIPLSLLLCILAFGLEGWILSFLVQVAALHDNSSLGMGIALVLVVLALLCLPLVALAVFLLIGRFFFDRTRRQKTFYALTNRRILIISTILKKRVRSIPLQQKPSLRLAQHPNGTGSIYLNVDAFLWWVLVGPPWWIPFLVDVEVYQPPFLERIPSAGQVYQQLQQLLANLP